MRPGSDPRWRPIPPAAARAPGLAPAALQRELWRRSDALPPPSKGDVFTPVPLVVTCLLLRPDPPARIPGLHPLGEAARAGPQPQGPAQPRGPLCTLPPQQGWLLLPSVPGLYFPAAPSVHAQMCGQSVTEAQACHCPALRTLNPPRPKAPSPTPAQVKSHVSAPSLAWLAFQPTWQPNMTFPPAHPTLTRVPVSAETATDLPAVLRQNPPTHRRPQPCFCL